jgi:hypothetical protein
MVFTATLLPRILQILKFQKSYSTTVVKNPTPRNATPTQAFAANFRKVAPTVAEITRVEVPAIWKDFGGKPFEGIRGVIADFKFPEAFNPADWNLVAHITTKDGGSILTQPFVASMTPGNRGVLSFTQREQTVWESSM